MRRAGRPSPVVGRDDELAVFARAVDAAGNGLPSVLLVAGEGGIGKSTLVAEAANRTGAPLYVGRCLHVGGDAIPLAPLVDLVRRAQRELSSTERETHALRALAEVVSNLRSADASGRAVDVFGLTLDAVRELGAAGPVLVAFEDLHWGDAASWDVFEYLARNLVDEHVVLVGTYRLDEVGRDQVLRRRVGELTRLASVTRFALAGLDRVAVAQHAASVLGVPPPRSLVEELVRRSAGNPFFVEELVAAHLAGEKIPALLWELLEAEIAEQDAATRQVVGAVATVGRDTDPELLGAIVELDERATEDAARRAIDARLLVVDPVTDAYRVRHPLIGEVAYASLLPSERRRLHRSITEALRATPRFALTATDAAGELAFHLDRAGDKTGALVASLAAADAAEAIAPAACLAHLERALALWEEHAPPELTGEHVNRLWQAAELASATGDNDRAVQFATAALAVGEPSERAWPLERLGRYLWAAGRMQESAATYEEAARVVESQDAIQDAAATFAGLAQADLMFCRFERAERWARRALDASTEGDAAA
ncbi:MAG TPA: AAA family ATPase, partial [Acidimicrobiales bacterium]